MALVNIALRLDGVEKKLNDYILASLKRSPEEFVNSSLNIFDEEKINHILERLSILENVKVDVPEPVEDLKPILEELNNKIEGYKKEEDLLNERLTVLENRQQLPSDTTDRINGLELNLSEMVEKINKVEELEKLILQQKEDINKLNDELAELYNKINNVNT